MLKDFVRKAIIRYAEEHNVNVRNVVLNAYFCDSEMCYALWVNNEAVKKLTFNEIMNVKFDFLNREAIFTPAFINGLLLTAQEYDIEPARANMFFSIMPSSDKAGFIYNILIYNAHSFVATLSSQQFTANFGVEMILNEGG